MSYKEKVLKARMLQSSLSKLLEIAYTEPALSLDERRSVVSSIYLAGSSGCSKNNKFLPERLGISTSKAQNALMMVFSKKLEDSPRLNTIDAIAKVSLLSSWAFSHPNRTETILNSFASNMVPEDMSYTVSDKNFDSVLKVVSALRKSWGSDKMLDLTTLTPKMWAKKYNQR